jgi:uncharacterized protein
MATAPPLRIVTLDIIRGVAVMGIFSVNVNAFAMIEAAYFNPGAYGGHTGANLAVWAANMLVIDGKMRSLFSMLFGASMLLVIDRAEAAGQSGWSVHWRRMVVLAAFGLAHYFLVWFGDILFLYAVCGLIVFAARNRTPQQLIVRGSIALALSIALLGSFAFIVYGQDIAAHAPGASAAAIASWNESGGGFYPSAAKLARDQALHLGSWSALTADGLAHWSRLIPGTLATLPETIALMMFGMAAFKAGLFTGEWSDAAYRRLAIWGIAVGLAAHAATVAIDIGTGFYVPAVMATFFVAMAPFRIAMALGIAALIILATRRTGWLAQRLAAVGRAAFSNYLGTSLLATFIFYGWGLGYYGCLSRAQAWLLVPIFWLAMLAWSKPWLDHFRYGPFEWAWRSLSRGRLQPMRKS